MKKRIALASALVILTLAIGGVFVGRKTHDVSLEGADGTGGIVASNSEQPVATDSNAPSDTSVFAKIGEKLDQLATNISQTISKPSVLLNAAFASQAPLGVWDALHEDACEEAAMIIAHNYVSQLPLNNQIMETGIQKMIVWENLQGVGPSVTIAEVQRIMKGYLENSKTRIIDEPTVEILKKELAAGNPIIVPAAGRELGNPYFTAPGPVYHMYVLIGYDDARKEFITNDPGTKRGAKFRYSYDVVLKSMHDWNPDNIDLGAKRVLVVDSK